MADLKVKAGDPISAKQWNQIVDRLPNPSGGFGAAIASLSRIVVTVKNNSGSDKDIGEAMTLDAWDGVADASDVYSVLESAAWTADAITWHSDIARICVCADPIPDGERGPAVIYGPCIIKLKSSQADNSYAMIDPAATTQFVIGNSGVARVLKTFASDNYAVAELGNCQPMFRYTLTQDSQAPSATTATLQFINGGNVGGSISLLDPQSFMDDQVNTDVGFCFMAGNQFYAYQATCGA